MANFYLSKALWKMAGGRECIPHIPLDPPMFVPLTCQFHLREPSGLLCEPHCSCSRLKSKSIHDAIEGNDCITPPTQQEINPITTIA